MINLKLKTHEQVYKAHQADKKLNPIDKFILDNEPADLDDEKKFRKGFLAALKYARKEID